MSTPQSEHCDSALAQGNEPIAGNYFVSAYPPFSVWSAEHVGEVRRVLETPSETSSEVPLGLYVHVPFCVKRCDYCYYLSYADKSIEEIDAYLDALVEETAMYGRAPALRGRRPTFVYFGGGTPTLPDEHRIARLVDRLKGVLPWTDAKEVTFECAPRTLTEAKLRVLKDAGVTRVSLGVQTFDDDVLKRNGRIHRVRHVERAFEAIRRVGFDIVNLDLIVGLVGERRDSLDRSLDRVIEMAPESVTVYQLEIPFNTPLYRAMCEQSLAEAPASWELKRKELAVAFARLEEGGYTVRSAYAAVRDPDRHHFVYQDAQYRGADLLGVGVASFSYLAGVHFQNQTSLERYLSCVNAGELPLGRAYPLSDEDRVLREFLLQLKLGRADATHFRDKFGVEITERFAEPLQEFADRGWLTTNGSDVTLTRDGLLRVDRLIPAFYPPHLRNARFS